MLIQINAEFESSSTHGEAISEEDLNTFPYNNIGRVFWVNPIADSEDNQYYGTGFYVGEKTIITVAHNHFNEGKKKEQPLTPVFIPGMINGDNIDERIYRKFVLDDIYIHTKYDGNFKTEYDICIAKVIEQGAKSLPECCLQLTSNSEIDKVDVIGYSAKLRKIITFSGTFKERKDNYLTISPAAYIGNSGGPWINKEDKVVGIQSSRSNDWVLCGRNPSTGNNVFKEVPICSHSPILSNTILEAVDKLKKIYNAPEQLNQQRTCSDFELY